MFRGFNERALARQTAMVKLGEVVAIGSPTTLTFDGIPDNFMSLLIHLVGRDTATGSNDVSFRQMINDDATAGNYSSAQYHGGIGSSSVADSTGNASSTAGGIVGKCPGTSGDVNALAVNAIHIIGYALPFRKITQTEFSQRQGGGAAIQTGKMAHYWTGLVPVRKLTYTKGATAFADGTKAVLYGIP